MRGFCVLVLCFCLLSCKETRKTPVFYANEVELDSFVESVPEVKDTVVVSPEVDKQAGDVVCVPYREEGGVKYVDVSVNGMPFTMIFDTGCSKTLISVSEARYLAEKGVLSADDFVGTTQSRIADGSIVENMVVNLREFRISDSLVFYDVEATVSSNSNAPLLLGNEVLNRVGSYLIDNQTSVIYFNLKK